MNYYHRIEYPDGRVFDGIVDRRKNLRTFGSLDVKGLRVLDIAANDGFFSFWAEQHGAAEVVAIDVGNYANYDWGFDGPPTGIENMGQQDKWEAFDFHHANLKSKVVKREMSVYDIESLGEFDIVFNFGLIYHLRNPVLALDKCRRVCRGVAFIETATSQLNRYLPVSIEMGRFTGVGSPTDTYLPAPACVAVWMKKACFPEVFVEGPRFRSRSTLIGVVDPKYMALFSNHEHCDELYWAKVQETVKQLIPIQP